MSDNSTEAKMNPDATSGAAGEVVDPGQLPGAAAKAVGGGLAAGSTDFGPSTAPIHGGRGAAGTSTSRTSQIGAPATGGGSGMAAAGNSVLNTGRPTRDDSRSAIGGEPRTGRPAPDRDSADSIRSAAGMTGLGNIGGGTAGEGNSGARDRAGDITGNPASAPNFVGADRGQESRVESADDQRSAIAQSVRDARRGIEEGGAQ